MHAITSVLFLWAALALPAAAQPLAAAGGSVAAPAPVSSAPSLREAVAARPASAAAVGARRLSPEERAQLRQLLREQARGAP